MEKSSFRRRWFVWLALTTLGTLLVVPATRHLFTTQARMATLTYSLDTDAALESAAAARLPNDYPVQLAHAAESPTSSFWSETDCFPADPPAKDPLLERQTRNQRIEALCQRFPDNPSAYANVLHYMTIGEVYARRDDDGSGPDPNADKRSHPVSSESLERFEAAVQKGRQLDPDNAYFPMMQAVGLFAIHRDAEALDAFKAAGHCSHWNVYAQDSFDGLNRLQCAAYGDRGAIQRLLNVEEQVFPYGVLRSAARVAIHLAKDQEIAGDRENALAVRHAVMRCGSLMRSQGTAFLTVIFGNDISNIATADPGGIPNPESLLFAASKKETPQQQAERRNSYYSYLQRTGHLHEAAWAETEINRGDQALAILRQAWMSEGAYGRYRFSLFGCWLDNIALLVSALALLLLGASAHLAGVFRPRRLPWLWRSAALLVIVGGIGCWQWQTLQCVHPYFLLQCMATNIVGNGAEGEARYTGIQNLVAILALLIPFLCVGLIAAVSLYHKVPLATGLRRGLRGIALPTAAILFLFYGLSLWPTVYTETAINTAITKTVHNQPHFLAESIHKVLPGDAQP